MIDYASILDRVASHFPAPGDLCTRKADGRRCVVVPSAPMNPERITVVFLDQRLALAYEAADWLERFEIVRRVDA